MLYLPGPVLLENHYWYKRIRYLHELDIYIAKNILHELDIYIAENIFSIENFNILFIFCSKQI